MYMFVPELHDDVPQSVPSGSAALHKPPLQTSNVQGLPSTVHGVLSGVRLFVGQAAADPVQFSTGSHTPVLARHTVVADFIVSAGHAGVLPVHVSAMSQKPALPDLIVHKTKQSNN